MALISTPILDLTNKDFASLRLRLQGLARSVTPTWTDFNAANIGNILLEMMAYVGDNLMFYVDAQAREMFWPTLTRRISAIRQGRLINFQLPGATAATGPVRISIPSPITKTVPIPLGTVLRSSDPVNPLLFRTTDDTGISIPIGQTFIDVDVEQTELISGESFESTNAPNQEFALARIPYLDDSLTVVATDGTYTPIDSFTNVVPTDTRKFVVLVDQNDRARVRFGNGVLGKIPQGSITVSYKLTQGLAGNVESGSVKIVLDTLLDSDGNAVTGVVASNPNKLEGGADRMSIAEARAVAPASLRALTRSVKNDDFEVNALETTGVARALMLTSNQDVSVAENSGILLLVARGSKLSSGKYQGGVPSATMLQAVHDDIINNKPPTTTFSLSVQAAVFKSINVTARIFLLQGAVPATVKADILSSLQDFFAVANEDGTANGTIDFGANLKNSLGISIGEIAWSDVMNAVRDVDGVRKVDEGASGLLLNNLRQSITIGLREFPQMGNVTIINADTGLAL